MSAIPTLDRVVFGRAKGPAFLAGQLGVRLGSGLGDSDLRTLLAWLQPLYGLEGSESLHVVHLELGFSEVYAARLNQRIGGTDVLGAWLSIRWRKDTGDLISISGALLADRNLPREPLLNADSALASHVSNRVGPIGYFRASGGPIYFLDGQGKGHLAWELSAQESTDGTAEHFRYLVDSQSGDMLIRRSFASDALNRSIYGSDITTNYSTTSPICGESGSCTDSDAAALKTLFGQVYQFWQSRFGRDSFDGAGRPIIGSLHNLSLTNNAGYHLGVIGSATNPDRFLFGTGDGVDWASISTGSSQDFVAHEFAHGVSHASIGRFFADDDESEAINEGLSDVFAAAYDAYANGLSSNTWKIFEDIYQPAPSYAPKAYRSMSDPVSDGRGSIDHWGDSHPSDAHLFAGILNLAFNRLVVGGGHPHGQSPGVAVPSPGLGMDEASSIFYKALDAGYVPLSPTFQQLRDATALAATDLHPSSTFERDAVHKAWDVVGVPGSPAQTAPPVVPALPFPLEIGVYCQNTTMNEVMWLSPESGPPVDYYELQWSQYSNFTSPVLIYSGPELSQTVTINSTSYIRLRACNTMGCSAYRGPKKVTYYQNCP